MAWNMSAAKRRALVKLQLRDKHGRFVEMGSGVKWFSSILGKEVSGEVVDGEGTSAVVRLNNDGGGKLVKVPAKNITVIDGKASLAPKGEEKPEGKSYSKMTDQDKIDAAEKMYGTGSEQHKKAIEKFGQDADNTPDTTTTPLTVSKTSDGNTYITAPEGAQLYTPAKELAVGDEVIAPDGADPLKPFSMGKGWATKNAERVNTQGPQIGKVVSIKEHAYAIVQLPEGEMVPHVKTGEPQNSVTVGLSNNVIKATPELKEQLKDVIPEPTYAAVDAPDNGTPADANNVGDSNDSGTGAGDSGQGGQVRDDSGSGDVQDSGGSASPQEAERNTEDSNGPLDPQYEALAKQIADLKAEITGTKAPVKRDRETTMNELSPLDTSNWKKVGQQSGSNPGGIFEDENGKQWYVKQSKSDKHARAEVLADQLYKAAGTDAPGVKLTTFNGKLGTASPMVDGAKSDLGSKYGDKAYMDKIREGFAVDAWLANWDVLGLGDDNIVTDANGNPVRIDAGGTMMFRAQGGLKNDSQPGAWGKDVKDWEGLRSKGEAQKAFKDMTDQQLVDSAARVEAVSPEEIDDMVDALGWDGSEAQELKDTLKARREDIIGKAKALGVEPSNKEPDPAPEAPAVDEPFEPVLPSAQEAQTQTQKPSYPKGTKENPNVLQGYTIEQNDRGVYFPKERLSISAWKGLKDGTIVPPSLPFIPYNTTNGNVHYWDSEGNRHWGQFGGAGALTRRKNAQGDYEYLLIQRASGLSTAPDMWTTPGGAHNNLEESKAKGITAKIELNEELGLDLQGDPIAEYNHATAPDWSYDYSVFDAPAGTDIDANSLDQREIQDAKWLTADQIQGMKSEGKLHPAMSDVVDQLLNASESVEGPSTPPETSNEDSNAPEAPSQAAEAPSLVEPDAAPNTDGPSVSMADGKPAYEGSKITHAKFGTGTVIKIIAGKSAKIEFGDGTVKIAQAHKISSFDGEVIPDAPVDTTGMAPGDFGNNPANGKLFIVGANGQAMYQGDKVSASHKGEEKNGTIKGIYKSTNSVAIIFDGEEKPVTKKAAVTSSLEKFEALAAAEPAAPVDPDAIDENGYKAHEKETVELLEAKLAGIYKGTDTGDTEWFEKALDHLYAQAEARLNGDPEPDDPENIVDRVVNTDDPVRAVEEMDVPEEAPDAPESLVEPDPEPVVEEMTVPEAAKEAPEEIVEPEPLVDPAPSPETAENLPAGTVLSVGEGGGTTFTKGIDGVWEMAVDGKPTLVIANKGMVQDMMDNHEVSVKKPGELTKEERLQKTLNELDEIDAMLKDKQSQDALSALRKKLQEAPMTPEDVQAPWSYQQDSTTEWEQEQADLNAQKKKAFDEIVGDKLNTPTGAVLDSFQPGTQIIASDDPKVTWTKTKSFSPIDGDPIWKDNSGYEASAFELAGGTDYKIVKYGQKVGGEESIEDWEKELLDAGEKQAKEAEEFYNSIDDIQTTKSPTGAEIEGLPTGSKVIFDDGSKNIWTKQGYTYDLDEGFIWKNENGEEASSLQLVNGKDMKTIQFGETEAEEESTVDAQKATEEDEAPVTAETLSKLPVNTSFGDSENIQYVKIGDSNWTAYNKGEPVASGSSFTDEQMAEVVNGIPDWYGMHKIGTFDGSKSEEVPDVSSTPEVIEQLSKLPIGSKIGSPDSVQYEKIAPNHWIDWFDGDKINSHEYGDKDIAQLVEETPDYSMDSVILPAGNTPVKEEGPAGTISGLSKDDFEKLPKGATLLYSVSGDSSDPTGIYTKNENGSWDYTPDGAENSTKTVESEKFDHLFEPDGVNPQFILGGRKFKASSEELPKVTPGIQKDVKLTGKAEWLDTLATGTTIKPQKQEYSWQPNNLYYVKQADGSWQEYKKTNSKTMTGTNYLSANMTYKFEDVTISEPLTDDHAVLGTGELAYTGDAVFFDGESYTVDKINKTGIKVTNSSTGAKVILKPHGLKKDLSFGKPKLVQSTGGFDPATEGQKLWEQKNAAKVAAKLEAEKLKDNLEKFSGASADDYDAYGITMPSIADPDVDNGVSVTEAKEADPTNPLYGTPKPVSPPPANTYPAYSPKAPEPLPKWDSAEWLKKVEERYEANPNKAKSTVQQSAKWPQIQAVLDGDKSNLDALVNSMYLDDAMRTEAFEGIKAQEEINAPLKAKMISDADEAKKEYDTKKAKAMEESEIAFKKYKEDLEEWLSANPSGNHYTKVKKPNVSKETFKGGEADWSKAHVGTYTAKDVLDSMRDDNKLGVHGLSFAVDSDQIDDLDIKTTKVLDAAGQEKFEFKFRLTPPHGDLFHTGLKADSSVTIENSIYPQRMVRDSGTGLMKDFGKPLDTSMVNAGTRYTYTDTMTGAKIVFQKSHSSGQKINVTDLDNTVKIHMPVDSTPEMFQQTLENMGIKKARPSTAGDIAVLAENKLIAMAGENINGGLKAYDNRMNMSGEDRKKALEKIKQDFGLTVDDMTFTVEPNGRVKYFLSDEKAAEFAKKYNVGHFKHAISNESGKDMWIGMITGSNPGLLSTYHRWTEGIDGKGMSSDSDLTYGSADGVYLTPKGPDTPSLNNSAIYINPKSIFKRMDYWANSSDNYGKKSEPGYDGQKTTPFQTFKQYNSASVLHEVTPKDSVPLSDWAFAVIESSAIRDAVIKELQEMGIFEINGIPLEQFLVTKYGTPPVDLTTPGTV